jgi:ABC-type taurine transport system substrate-binding protein
MPSDTNTLDDLRVRYRAARDYVIESDLGPCTVAAFNAWVVGEVGRNPAALVAFAEGAAQEAREYDAQISEWEWQATRRERAYHRGVRGVAVCAA